MSSSLRNGLLLAVVHIGLVASLGAKLLIDRGAYPRVWARAVPLDPQLPIRGRYVSLRLEATMGPGLDLPSAKPVVNPNGGTWTPPAQPRPIELEARDGALVALPAGHNGQLARARQTGGQKVVELVEPVAFFIPEGVADPSRRSPGEELWVEVTLPRRGPPRPIRLGIKKNDVLTPLEVH